MPLAGEIHREPLLGGTGGLLAQRLVREGLQGGHRVRGIAGPVLGAAEQQCDRQIVAHLPLKQGDGLRRLAHGEMSFREVMADAQVQRRRRRLEQGLQQGDARPRPLQEQLQPR